MTPKNASFGQTLATKNYFVRKTTMLSAFYEKCRKNCEMKNFRVHFLFLVKLANLFKKPINRHNDFPSKYGILGEINETRIACSSEFIR